MHTLMTTLVVNTPILMPTEDTMVPGKAMVDTMGPIRMLRRNADPINARDIAQLISTWTNCEVPSNSSCETGAKKWVTYNFDRT